MFDFCICYCFKTVFKGRVIKTLNIQFYITMKRKNSASVYFDKRRGEISQKEKLKGS